jgi:AraC family transcriptional regulator
MTPSLQVAERVFVNPEFSVTHTCKSPVGPHAHLGHLVSYYFGGHARCRIGVQSVEFETGNIGLLNSGEVHEDFILPEHRDYLMVGFKQEFLLAVLSGLGATSRELPRFSIPKIETDAQIQRICEDLREENQHNRLGREALLKSLVTELAIHVLRRFMPEPSSDLRTTDFAGLRLQIRKALEYLQDTFTEDFDLDRVAEAANLSKFYLDRVFKRATGLRPHTYVALLRVDKAKLLLAQTSRSIADIALELGFADQSHFSNVFKQFSGLSPRAYRVAVNGHAHPPGSNRIQDAASRRS